MSDKKRLNLNVPIDNNIKKKLKEFCRIQGMFLPLIVERALIEYIDKNSGKTEKSR